MSQMKEVNFGMPKAGGPGQLSPVPLVGRPGFGAPPDPNAPPPPFPIPTAEFRPQVYIKDGELQSFGAEGTVGGQIGAEQADGLRLECSVPTANGVYVDGRSKYTIQNAEIVMSGDCVNDFAGNGAGLQVAEQANVTIENSRIDVSGVLRPCILTDDHSNLTVRNCELICRGGEPAPDHPGHAVPLGMPGMLQAPPSMEVDGHSRLCLVSGNAHARFYDCTMVADAWAALSTDAAWGDVYLEANRCDITVERPGYGVFSDEGCVVVLNDCKVKAASHTAMVQGNAKLRMNGCKFDSDRFGIYVFAIICPNGAQLADMSLHDCEIRAKEAPILIRGTNSYMDMRNVKLVSDSGVLIKTEVFLDPNAAKVNPGEPLYGVKAAFSDMELCGDIVHEDHNRPMALSYFHTFHRGAICNAAMSMDRASSWFATGDSCVNMMGEFELSQIDAAEGVTIRMDWAAQPEHREISLPSGGRLIIN